MNKVLNNKYGERILAKNFSVSNNTRATDLNNNDLIIGPSGAGKTGGYVIPNMLSSGESLIVADTKRSLSRKYEKAMQNMGYKTYIIDFVEPEKSTVSYNPFDYIRRDKNGKPNEMDIETITAALAPLQTKDDPFWDISARNVLGTLIGFNLEVFAPEEQNLSAVTELYRIMLAQTPSSEGVSYLEEHLINHPDSYASKQYRLFKNVMGAERTWGCISQFLTNAVRMFDIDGISSLFNGKNKINIPDISHEKSVVFLNISDSDHAFDKLVNLFYTQALQALIAEADRSSETRLEIPVRMILDDFATNVVIPNFDKIISVIRSRDIAVSIIVQSLSQLNSMYTKPQADTIINNCDHVVYLGGSDFDTASYVSSRANKSKETVLSMPLDKAYIMERGKQGLLLDKIKPYSFKVPKQAARSLADTQTSFPC